MFLLACSESLREFGFLNSSSISFDFSTIKMQAVLQLWKVSFFTQSPFSFLKFVEKDAITSSAYMAFMVNIVDQEERHRLNRIAMWLDDCQLLHKLSHFVFFRISVR